MLVIKILIYKTHIMSLRPILSKLESVAMCNNWQVTRNRIRIELSLKKWLSLNAIIKASYLVTQLYFHGLKLRRNYLGIHNPYKELVRQSRIKEANGTVT